MFSVVSDKVLLESITKASESSPKRDETLQQKEVKEQNCSMEEFLTSLDTTGQHRQDGTFYFETDYLALKGNHDYIRLIKALAVLEVQRIKTCQDIETIEKMKVKVKEDPGSVLKDILSGNINLNARGKIEKVPDIDWSKYKNLCFGYKPPTMTRRRAKKLVQGPSPEKFLEPTPSTSSVVDNWTSVENSLSEPVLVRGRKYDQNKPETFNQLWTVEEQLRLEQLLVEFPPEPIEWRRWEKISNALGNRTAKQVCSRVQKYFRKLRQVGVAVPGRSTRTLPKPRLVHRRNKHLLYRPTTFFPGVAMAEMNDESEDDNAESNNEPDMSHWVHILETIKQEKTKADQPAYRPVLHYGYKCMGCDEEPIKGLRWECKTCQDCVVSSCCDCLVNLVSKSGDQTPCHPASHVFQPSHLYTNPHYSTQSYSTNNYLDPNFIA